MNEENGKTFIAIDRLTGQPFAMNRDDSDAGMAADFLNEPWTIEAVQTRAKALGKEFNPNTEIAGQLEADLAAGAQVYFTESEITEAVEQRLVPKEWENDLIDLVTNKNDTAIIPAQAVEQWQREQLAQRFLFDRK